MSSGRLHGGIQVAQRVQRQRRFLRLGAQGIALDFSQQNVRQTAHHARLNRMRLGVFIDDKSNVLVDCFVHFLDRNYQLNIRRKACFSNVRLD